MKCSLGISNFLEELSSSLQKSMAAGKWGHSASQQAPSMMGGLLAPQNHYRTGSLLFTLEHRYLIVLRKWFSIFFWISFNLKISSRDFPGGPVIKIVCFQLSGCGSIPSWGTKIPHATWRGPKKKQERNLIKREKLNLSFSFSNSIAKGSGLLP